MALMLQVSLHMTEDTVSCAQDQAHRDMFPTLLLVYQRKLTPCSLGVKLAAEGRTECQHLHVLPQRQCGKGPLC